MVPKPLTVRPRRPRHDKHKLTGCVCVCVCVFYITLSCVSLHSHSPSDDVCLLYEQYADADTYTYTYACLPCLPLFPSAAVQTEQRPPYTIWRGCREWLYPPLTSLSIDRSFSRPSTGSSLDTELCPICPEPCSF